MREEENGGHRRSARISALEEKAKAIAVERKGKAAMIEDDDAPRPFKRRGRKRKSLHDMEVKSRNEENARNQSLQERPNKFALEFILDLIIQKKEPMLLQHSDPDQKIKDDPGNVNDSPDFAAVRAKIEEGAYSSIVQFERDISQITKIPMNFCSTAKFLSEARIISKLADELFGSTRTEPEKLASGDTQNRSDGKKLLGSRRGEKFEFYDRRATYKPKKYSKTKKESLLLPELKEPQILELVPKSKGAYIKSYLSFLNGLGPKAKLFGSRQLIKSLNAAATPLTNASDPKTRQFNSVGSVRPYTYLRGARPSPVLREPPHPQSGNVGLLPRNFISNPQASYKGKGIAVDDGRNSFNAYGGGMNSYISCLPWERPLANNGRSGSSFFSGGITDVDTSNTVDFNDCSNDKTTGNDEDNHLLFATLWQHNSPNTSLESSCLPPNTSGRFPNVPPSKMITPSLPSTMENFAGSMNFPGESWNTPSQSSVQKNYTESMMFHTQWQNSPSPSTPNNCEGLMSFPIQSPNIPPSSSTPRGYAESMCFQMQSPNTPLPGNDSLYAKGNEARTPIPGLEYYKHPQPFTSRNTTAPETPWFETVKATAETEHGFNFMDPFGEGSSLKFSEDIQNLDLNGAGSWSMQTTVDPPNLQAEVINEEALPRYSFMQLLQGIPQEQDFLDETGFLQETVPQGHQALPNTPSMPIDLEWNERPDLNVQL